MPIRILIADDHAVVRQGLRMFLGDDAEIEVVGEAANGAEAVALARSLKPDVVLMDLLMPVMDGIELCRALRATDWGQTMYIIMVTGVESDDDVNNAFESGVDDYVAKPIFSREGANVEIRRGGVTVAAPEGPYDTLPRVIQALAPEVVFDRMRPVIGSWIIDQDPAGIGIREDAGLVTGNASCFVPHAIVD